MVTKDYILAILFYLAKMFMVFVLLPATAHSQIFCGTGKVIKDDLEKHYGEVVVNMGNTKTGLLMLLFVSQKTHTWTMVTVNPMGPTCIIASGDNWEVVVGKILGEPS